MRNLFCTVVYESMRSYVVSFLDSIRHQTSNNFDLLIVNDGFNDLEKQDLTFNTSLNIINIKDKMTISEVRYKCFEYAIENKYTNLIFADSDDLCIPKRVEVTIEYLDRYDIVFNQMTLIDEADTVIKSTYYDFNNVVNPIAVKDLLDVNYIGLSNVGLKVELLKHCFPVYSDLIAVDWWVATNIAFYTNKIGFINEPLTLYRQYDNNLVGANARIKQSTLLQAIRVKKIHYSRMTTKYKIENIEISNLFKNKYIEILALEKFITQENKISEVINLLNEYKTSYAWWECAMSLKRLEEIKNEISTNRRFHNKEL